MKLKENEIYDTDNGALLHGKCCGGTARMTGRDLSGRRVVLMSQRDRDEWLVEFGKPMTCESCGLERLPLSGPTLEVSGGPLMEFNGQAVEVLSTLDAFDGDNYLPIPVVKIRLPGGQEFTVTAAAIRH